MILIVTAQFNGPITHAIQKKAMETLQLEQKKYTILEVPGAVELPIAVQQGIKNLKPEAVIAIGCVIKGGTDHYEYVIDTCRDGLTKVALDMETPVIHGVLACHNSEQAQSRTHLGEEWARTAIHMAELIDELQ